MAINNVKKMDLTPHLKHTVNSEPGWIELNFAPEKAPKRPVVSVIVQTYQHGPYIRQCLDSIVNQTVDFELEVLVGEDCSIDGTREICIEFAQKHPHLVRLFLHDRSNQISFQGIEGGRFNLLTNLENARGRYVALCEGDDYWIDKNKLQIQHDLLEQDSESSACFHLVETMNSEGKICSKSRFKTSAWTNRYMLKNYPYGCPIHTCSLFFRRQLLDISHEWFTSVPVADWVMVCLLAEQNPIRCVNRRMGCYRVHDGGVWSSMMVARKCRQSIQVLKQFKRNFGSKYADEIDYALSLHYWRLSNEMKKNGKRRSALVIQKSVFANKKLMLMKIRFNILKQTAKNWVRRVLNLK